RAIAHARVEEPHGGRRRLQHGQLVGGAPRYRRLLVAGGHEGQVLLAVVVEAKRSRGRLGGRTGIPARRLGHGASAPEPRGGDPRALDHGGELEVGDLRLDRSKAGEGAEAAVGSGDHPLAPDDVREALDTLGDELRVLDVVGRGGEDSRDQDLVLGYLRSLEYG